MRNLDMTALRSFVAVADHGGVTRAAGVLNFTQSAVSMQLKRLEEMLGLSLLDRTTRKIALRVLHLPCHIARCIPACKAKHDEDQ